MHTNHNDRKRPTLWRELRTLLSSAGRVAARPYACAMCLAVVAALMLGAATLAAPLNHPLAQEQDPPTPAVETPTPGEQEPPIIETPQIPDTPTATPTATRPPRTGLVLVPLAVRPGTPSSDAPPDAGILRGKVLDNAAGGLNGQVVKVTRQGFSVTVATDGNGAYEVLALPPGKYTVVVDKQISSPVEGLDIVAGTVTQVDFVEVRGPAATPTAGRGTTPTATPTPTATATRTATPRPTATLVPTATPTPRTAPQNDVGRWWTSLGIDIRMPDISAPFYLGAIGGMILVVLGIVAAAIRR
jgi:hypothetical protein